MARRRYISTNIGKDKAINRLALEHGDFAVLLYTWLIPCAEDDCTLPSDPEEILYEVMPGRRDKTPEDVQQAIDAMVSLGLLEYSESGKLREKPDSFYKYQSYIKPSNRTAENAAKICKTPQSAENAGEQRKTPENAASFPLSFPPSFPPSFPLSFRDEDTYCAEFRENAASTPPIITLPLNDKSEYPVYEEQAKKWADLYPAVDVIQQLRSMRGWLDANPAKRKTKTGIQRFINGWLAKEQDKGGGASLRGAPQNIFLDMLKEEKT